MFKIPDYVNELLELLYRHNYEAFIVGGCVRDFILSIEPHDYDITTNAIPHQLVDLFKEYKFITTGLKHGTLTVINKKKCVEITTYRIDGEYQDNRHPRSVVFSSFLEDDLSRRDFTINALAYSKKTGIIDCFNSMDDLNNKVIRCVGSPDLRFCEDSLRIMRAIRFSATYSLVIEKETEKAMYRSKELLRNISIERIQSEFNKLICGKSSVDVLRAYRDIIAIFIPEIVQMFDFEQRTTFHCYDIYEHTLHSIENIEANLELRLTMFFHDIGKPMCYKNINGVGHFKGHSEQSVKIAEVILTRLRYSNEVKRSVLTLIKYHDIKLECSKPFIKKWLNKLAYKDFVNLVKVHMADDYAKSKKAQNRIPIYNDIIKLTDEIIKSGECYSLKQLKINGSDLMSLGIEGQKIGYILNKILFMVIEEKYDNNRDVLLQAVKIIIANK